MRRFAAIGGAIKKRMRNETENSSRVQALAQLAANPFINRLVSLPENEREEALKLLTYTYHPQTAFKEDAEVLRRCIFTILDHCTTHNHNVEEFNFVLQALNYKAQRWENLSNSILN